MTKDNPLVWILIAIVGGGLFLGSHHLWHQQVGMEMYTDAVGGGVLGLIAVLGYSLVAMYRDEALNYGVALIILVGLTAVHYVLMGHLGYEIVEQGKILLPDIEPLSWVTYHDAIFGGIGLIGALLISSGLLTKPSMILGED